MFRCLNIILRELTYIFCIFWTNVINSGRHCSLILSFAFLASLLPYFSYFEAYGHVISRLLPTLPAQIEA